MSRTLARVAAGPSVHDSASRVGRGTLARVLLLGVAIAATLSGCAARPNAVHLAAIEDPRVEGDWVGPDGVAVQVEREGRNEYEAEITFPGDPDELEFPMRLLRPGGTLIAELKVVQEEGGSRTVYRFHRLDVAGDEMRERPLSAEWARAWAQAHPTEAASVTVETDVPAPLIGGSTDGIRRMLEAAAADESAWGQATLWKRAE